MDSNMIEKLFYMDNEIRKHFIGVYPVDMIPPLNQIGSIMVVNLDPSFMKGSHWIVLYVRDKNKVEYFDSLGKKPRKDIITHLFHNHQICIYNSQRVQDYNTNSCGLFCLFYSYYACRLCTMISILSCFDDNLKNNEQIVTNFTKTYFSLYHDSYKLF